MLKAKNNRKTISIRPILIVLIIFTAVWLVAKWYKGRSTPIRCGLIVYAISYSPDGHYIAFAGHKGSNPEEMAFRGAKATIQIWDTTKWIKVDESPYLDPVSKNPAYDWDRRFVTALMFTHDNRYLMASADYSGSFGIYDIKKHIWSHLILSKREQTINKPIGFSTDDQYYSYAELDISKLPNFTIYGVNQQMVNKNNTYVPINIVTSDLANNKRISKIPLKINKGEWPVLLKTLNDGNIVCLLKHGIGIFTRNDGGRILLVNGLTKKIISSRDVVSSPINILTTNTPYACLVLNKSIYQIWDLTQFTQLNSFTGTNTYYEPSAISPNGSKISGMLLSISGEYLGYVIKDKDGKTLTTLQGLKPDYGSSAFSPDGKSLVTAHMKKDGIEIWNVN